MNQGEMAEHHGGDQSSEVLSVRHLTTEFRTRDGVVQAVRDVSFDLIRGEKLAVVGESGSGKSTLGLSLLGLVESPGRITGGSIVLNGRDIRRFSDRELGRIRGREISLIFQDSLAALDPVQTIGNQIVEAIAQHQSVGRKAARRLATELLLDVEVPNARQRLDDYPHQFSGGMRQRVMIAIALANQPTVVVADEPTTALDVTTQAQVLAVLDRAASERGTAVLFITHNMGIVAEFCDSCVVMYAGRLVERATVNEIFERPVHPYTAALLASIPRAGSSRAQRLASIPGSPPSLVHLPAGCTYEPRCAVGHGNSLCIRDIPPVVILPTLNPHSAECHFARERWDAYDEENALDVADP